MSPQQQKKPRAGRAKAQSGHSTRPSSAAGGLEQVAGEVRQHARQLVRELDLVKGVYLDSGYSFSQCHLLFELGMGGRMNLGQLAQRLLIDKSNASRAMKKLLADGLVEASPAADDARQKLHRLTPAGAKVLRSVVDKADAQVAEAIQLLDEQQANQVVQGLKLYARALRESRLQAGFELRRLRKSDNAAIAELIRQVMTEFAAVGEGYSIGDAEVQDMYGNYRPADSCYLVIEQTGTRPQIQGGGGIAPLAGGPAHTCELRKMFFLPELRGRGLGRRLLQRLLQEARDRGYRQCYLETLSRMSAAIGLYRASGFRELDGPWGATGHHQCDCWFALDLQNDSHRFS